MLSQINNFMRTHCAPLHTVAKALVSPWMNSGRPTLPAVRSLHGYVLRMHPRFLTTELNSIESDVMTWLQRNLRDGSTALDIGANVGMHTMYMAKLVGASGAVHAFEPSPANIALLRYHVRANHFRQVQIVEKAVADVESGTLPFFLLNDGDHPSNSLTFGRPDVPNLDSTLHRNCRTVRTETVSIDRYCADAQIQPDLIKIDVEGAELQVLQGAARTLCAVRPTLILAIHPWWLPQGQTTEDIVSFLTHMGYAIAGGSGEQAAHLRYGEYLCEPVKTPATLSSLPA